MKIQFTMLKKYILLNLVFALPSLIWSQSELPVGVWQSHLSYKDGRCVTQSKNKVIYASTKGLFTIDKNDISIEFLSKEDGFTDVSISNLYFDNFNDQLIIIYSDNNIDILKGNEILNIPFIKTNTSVLGSKTVNDVFVSNQDLGYIATDFGILGFNLKELEFPFTTFTQLKVNAVASLDNILFAGTEEGLYSINTKTANVSDFSSWKHISDIQGMPQISNIKSLAVKYGQLFVLVDNKVFKMEESGNFINFFSPSNSSDVINYLSDEGSNLMIGIENNNESKTLFIDSDGKMTESGYGCLNKAIYAVEDEKGRVWYADLWEPIRYTERKIGGDCNKLSFQVPFANDASGIRFKKEKAYFGSNGVTEDYQYRFTLYGYYTLENKIWTNFNPDVIPALREKEFFHLFSLAPHPKTNEIYLGSYYNGIMLYNEETKEIQHWNKDNSILKAVVGDEARTRIAGLTFDKDENLWISNFGSPKPIVVKTKDNEWYSFSVPGSTNLAEIAIDNQGNKWIAVVGVGNGVIVFNEGDLSDPTDDKIRYISRNNSEIIGNKINCVLVDLDGSVWIGTDQGPVVFDCGDPFNENCRGNTRKVVVDDIPAPLLRYEDILCMEIDGGNQKWFGTRNGIFVQSPDGITQKAKFDERNSPLLNNKVTDLAYNGITGEMFIVSNSGIQSYKTETTSGGRSHNTNVYAFPNPVRPDHNGPIAIKGLVRDANVKITDINGRLVYETKALGGQAIWDGFDYNGQKASTGVYLVFSANENTSLDSDALVTKILFVN